MKRSMKFTTLSILVLAGSTIALGGNQTRVRPTRSEAQDVQGSAPAIQQGKGGGITRNQTLSQTGQQNAGNSRGAAETRDSAYRK